MKARRVLTATAALASGIGLTVATSPAQAGEYCPTNHVCMWEDANFNGGRYVDTELGGVGSTGEVPWWDGHNEISSIENGSTTNWLKVFDGNGQTGTYICVAPKATMGALGSFDNLADSWALVSSCP